MDNFGERQHSSSGDYYLADFWVLKISSDIYPATSDRVELATAPALTRNPDTSFGPQPAFLDRGLIRLSLIGISNRVHVVEASTNLVDWFGVSTNRLGSYGTIVADRTATHQTRRFYRARALDP